MTAFDLGAAARDAWHQLIAEAPADKMTLYFGAMAVGAAMGDVLSVQTDETRAWLAGVSEDMFAEATAELTGVILAGFADEQARLVALGLQFFTLRRFPASFVTKPWWPVISRYAATPTQYV